MLRLVWDASALEDLRRIIGDIADRNLAAAERLQDIIERAAEQLPAHPYLYRPGRVPGTREAVLHPNYILVYRVGVETVEVLAIVHARRQYP
jgi:addiction module RelE/StbE family toxin